jgi:hypothetical protein
MLFGAVIALIQVAAQGGGAALCNGFENSLLTG